MILCASSCPRKAGGELEGLCRELEWPQQQRENTGKRTQGSERVVMAHQDKRNHDESGLSRRDPETRLAARGANPQGHKESTH